jgi:TRAP-type C4-dicarboxylate transport system permease small subunit
LIDALSRWVRLVENGLLVGMLGVMIFLAAYQVIARNFFESGLIWGDSAVRIAVLWVTLLGAMVASRNDTHIRMDVISQFVDEAARKLLRRIGSVFTCVVCGLFAWYSFQFVVLDYQDEIIAFGRVPAWICEAIMPVGGAVMSFRYLLHVFRPV